MQTSLIYSQFNGSAAGDHEAESWARNLKRYTMITSTENVVHAYRLLLMQGFFEEGEVETFFECTPGEFLPVQFDKDGRTENWYVGFCDTNDKILQGLLGWDGLNETSVFPHDGERYLDEK